MAVTDGVYGRECKQILRHRENVCEMLSVKGYITTFVVGWSQNVFPTYLRCERTNNIVLLIICS